MLLLGLLLLVVATAPPGSCKFLHPARVVNGSGSATAASAAVGGGGGGSSSKLLRSCPSLFMFMFRSRRNALVKRLWRQAALRRGGGGGGDDDDPTPGETAAAECAPEATSEEQQVKSWIKSAAHALFKRLTDDQLALLLDILDGASTSPCFPLDTDLVNSKTKFFFILCKPLFHFLFILPVKQEFVQRKESIGCCVVCFDGRNCQPGLN